MKKCYSCQTIKDASDFTKNKTKKDGLSHYCRQCSKEKYHLARRVTFNDDKKPTNYIAPASEIIENFIEVLSNLKAEKSKEAIKMKQLTAELLYILVTGEKREQRRITK